MGALPERDRAGARMMAESSFIGPGRGECRYGVEPGSAGKKSILSGTPVGWRSSRSKARRGYRIGNRFCDDAGAGLTQGNESQEKSQNQWSRSNDPSRSKDQWILRVSRDRGPEKIPAGNVRGILGVPEVFQTLSSPPSVDQGEFSVNEAEDPLC